MVSIKFNSTQNSQTCLQRPKTKETVAVVSRWSGGLGSEVSFDIKIENETQK